MKKSILAVLGLASVSASLSLNKSRFPVSTKPYTIETTKNGKKIKVYK